MNFLLFMLLQTCGEFEQRVGQIKYPRCEKTESVIAAVERLPVIFRVADVKSACPGVGIDLIRRVLANLQHDGKVRSLGCKEYCLFWRRRKH